MSPAPARGLTARSGRIEVAEASRRLEHAVVLGATARAGTQVDRGAREAAGRLAAAQLDLDVLLDDRLPRVAPRIAGFGAQQVAEPHHAWTSSSLSAWPAAARLARSLRRASK